MMSCDMFVTSGNLLFEIWDMYVIMSIAVNSGFICLSCRVCKISIETKKENTKDGYRYEDG